MERLVPPGVVALLVCLGALTATACSTSSPTKQESAPSQDERKSELCEKLATTCAWLSDTTGHRAQLHKLREEGRALMDEKPTTPEAKVQTGRALIVHARKFEILLNDMKTMPLDVFYSAEAAHHAELDLAGLLLNDAASAYQVAGKNVEAKDVYAEILRTFTAPSQAGLRIKAETELHALEEKARDTR